MIHRLVHVPLAVAGVGVLRKQSHQIGEHAKAGHVRESRSSQFGRLADASRTHRVGESGDAAVGRRAVTKEETLIFTLRKGVGDFTADLVCDRDESVLVQFAGDGRQDGHLLCDERDLLEGHRGLGDGCRLTNEVRGQGVALSRDAMHVGGHGSDPALGSSDTELLAETDQFGLEHFGDEEATRTVDAFGVRLGQQVVLLAEVDRLADASGGTNEVTEGQSLLVSVTVFVADEVLDPPSESLGTNRRDASRKRLGASETKGLLGLLLLVLVLSHLVIGHLFLIVRLLFHFFLFGGSAVHPHFDLFGIDRLAIFVNDGDLFHLETLRFGETLGTDLTRKRLEFGIEFSDRDLSHCGDSLLLSVSKPLARSGFAHQFERFAHLLGPLQIRPFMRAFRSLVSLETRSARPSSGSSISIKCFEIAGADPRKFLTCVGLTTPFLTAEISAVPFAGSGATETSNNFHWLKTCLTSSPKVCLSLAVGFRVPPAFGMKPTEIPLTIPCPTRALTKSGKKSPW